jgi:hypothetical protein
MRPVALALAALLLLPAAAAHIPHARGQVQPSESSRIDEVRMNGTAAEVTMIDTGDRLRHLVTQKVDPGHLAIDATERDDSSVADANALHARFEISRLLLYHDANADGAYEPGTDLVLKSWRYVNYVWKTDGVRQVGVGGLTGVSDVFWTGTLGGAPNATLEMVAAGEDVTDEGATARPQDLLLYLTVPSLPPRDVGSLYAFEGAITAPAGSTLGRSLVDNLTLDAHADEPGGRRAYLDWGGQATVDRREANVTFDADPPQRVGGDDVFAVRWSLPLTDRSIRLVMVSAVEYPVGKAPLPDVGLAGAGAALAVAALLPRRR